MCITYNTNRYIRHLRNTAGVVEMRVDTFVALLANLGYEINEEDSFDYVNYEETFGKHYARSIAIDCVKTGLNFSNISALKENMKELQKLRAEILITSGGNDRITRIWEL